jgi:hypothetical protein
MIAYFDTNVFDHVEQRNGVSDWDLYRLAHAVKQEYLQIVLSFLNIEEILFIAQSKPERAKAQLKLILELADKRLFVLGQDEVMNNDIRAFAYDKPTGSPFMMLTPGMEFDIRTLMCFSKTQQQDLDSILQETRLAKERFLENLLAGRKELTPMAAGIGTKQYPFERYLANNSGWLAEGLAEQGGVLHDAQQRGIEGLLKVKSVSVAVGANLSLLYSHHFDGHAPSSGDSRDMLHALLSSVADVFVTNDRKLEKILARVHVGGWKVQSLRNFLDALPSWI